MGAVAAAVLAGGASRRMGRDKATMPVGGTPLAGLVLAAGAPAGALLEAGARSLRGLLAALRTLVVEDAGWRRLDPDGRSFADLDDPAAVAAWRRRPAGER